MTEAAAPPDPKADKQRSTRERYLDLTNMSPKEVRDYLGSEEFKHHGSRAIEQNARRLLVLAGGGSKGATLEDSALLRDAISVIERAKFASGNDLAETICKARAYGYDPERAEGERGPVTADSPEPEYSNDDEPEEEEDEAPEA